VGTHTHTPRCMRIHFDSYANTSLDKGTQVHRHMHIDIHINVPDTHRHTSKNDAHKTLGLIKERFSLTLNGFRDSLSIM